MAKHDPFRPGPGARNASRRTTVPRGSAAAARPSPTPPGRGPQRRRGVASSPSWPSPADRAPDTPVSDLVDWIRSAPTYDERNARILRVRESERSRSAGPRDLVISTMSRLEAEPFPVVTPDPEQSPVGPLADAPAEPLTSPTEPVTTTADAEVPSAEDVPAKATEVVAWLRTADTQVREARARAALEVESSRDTPRKVVQDAIVRVLGEDA